MKFVLVILSFVCFEFVSAQNVFYGERDRGSKEVAVYFDKEGFPYPNYFISDSSMTMAGGSLLSWFLQNNEAFIELSASYQLFPERIDPETINQLRGAILSGIAKELNAKAKNYPTVAFYIHGFRKSFKQKNSDVTSVEEFQLLRDDLARYRNEQQQVFEVTIYWDGMYDCCFSKDRKRNKELFELFEQARHNAYFAGWGLRSLLMKIESDSIQLVAHSLGAKVVTSALFDRFDFEVPTPPQKDIRICLIAPAIERKTFENYYNRFPRMENQQNDNYHLMIVYNEKDFVLKKKDPKVGLFGPGPKRYGRTTLGCNWHKDAIKLQRYFQKYFPNSELVLEDMTRIGKCHSLRCYTKEDYLKSVSDFLWN